MNRSCLKLSLLPRHLSLDASERVSLGYLQPSDVPSNHCERFKGSSISPLARLYVSLRECNSACKRNRTATSILVCALEPCQGRLCLSKYARMDQILQNVFARESQNSRKKKIRTQTQTQNKTQPKQPDSKRQTDKHNPTTGLRKHYKSNQTTINNQAYNDITINSKTKQIRTQFQTQGCGRLGGRGCFFIFFLSQKLSFRVRFFELRLSLLEFKSPFFLNVEFGAGCFLEYVFAFVFDSMFCFTPDVLINQIPWRSV